MSSNLILIGMPGAGKSTVGVLLAKHRALDFIDTDLLLQRRLKLRLQQMINLRGLHSFRAAEEEVLLDLECQETVIATGGSVIYSEKGMQHLKDLGKVIYLKISLPLLTQRISDMGQRGIVFEPGQNFASLYADRTPRYKQYADLEIDIDNLDVEDVLRLIENNL